MRTDRSIRLLMLLALVGCLWAGAPAAHAQEPLAGTPIPEPTATLETPVVDATPTATATASATATEAPLEPAAASPTATPASGIVDNGDGSYTLTANPGDIVDLDLSSLLPAGGIVFQQIVSLSATIVGVDGACSAGTPGFYLNEFVQSPPTQGIIVAVGDPGNNFACAIGATGNLIQSGDRFAQYHTSQSGGPPNSTGLTYGQALEVLNGTNLPNMAFRVEADDSDVAISVTIRDIAISIAPIAALSVAVQLCRTSDAEALARRVDYALDPFGPAAADCTPLDPAGIPITTNLLDDFGAVLAAFDATVQSDGSLSALPEVGSASSLQFSEGLYGTISDPLAIPDGGGANVGITIYVSGVPGSISLSLVNAVGGGGLSGSTFTLLSADCTGASIRTVVTDDNGNASFALVPDGTYCVAQTVPRSSYEPVAPAPQVSVSSGEAVTLDPFVAEPPLGPYLVTFAEMDDSSKRVPGICATLYMHAGYPESEPSGPLTGLVCDTDLDGEVEFEVPIDVSFAVIARVLPTGYAVTAPVVDGLSPGDLPGGRANTQLIVIGMTTDEAAITSLFCAVAEPDDARVVITSNDGTATPGANPGCEPFDASFQVVPFGVDSGYPPLTVTTVNGVASLELQDTGASTGVLWPNTLHALIDNQRPGASGKTVTFDVPTEILILVYDLPATPSPTATVTVTATATATVTPAATLTPAQTVTPAPEKTVVALPNTGAGNATSGSAWLVAILLALAGLLGGVLARSKQRG